jgi:hypothetical protein
MTPLERRNLERICDKYGIDYYEIDSGINYSENKEHLMGIVRMLDGSLDCFELARMMEQQEQYIAENPLEYYMSCRIADQIYGEKEAPALGEPDTSPQRFSLRTRSEIGFSLRELVKGKS